MNIFILDEDPVQAARYQCDKHVVKMIVESCQLLCNALRHMGHQESWLYKPTHLNHPCSIWARQPENFHWLRKHLSALLGEYTNRYQKIHKCETMLWNITALGIPGSYNNNIQFVMCMPEEYIVSSDPVKSYRAYYRQDKAPICKWKLGNKPYWF